jgi:hypothetical protein
MRAEVSSSALLYHTPYKWGYHSAIHINVFSRYYLQ